MNVGTENETEKRNGPESKTRVAAGGVRKVAQPYSPRMGHLEGGNRTSRRTPHSFLRMIDLPFGATAKLAHRALMTCSTRRIGLEEA